MTEIFNPLKSEIFYTKDCPMLSSHALNLQCIKYVSNHCLFRLELINYISNSQHLSLSFLLRLKLLIRSTTLFYGMVKIILLFVVTQIFTFIFVYFKKIKNKKIYIFTINLIFFLFSSFSLIFVCLEVIIKNTKKIIKKHIARVRLDE
jgi:hypothetical protein